MKWLYLPFPRSTITQPFDKNYNPLYKGQGLKGHTSIDWNASCGTPLYNCAEGYCYSVRNKDAANLAQYRAAYFLVENQDGVFEVSYGHLTDIYAEPGKTYKVGDLIGTTGNTGDVYAGGVKVTKYRPGCPGGHLHGPQVRVLKKTKTKVSSKKYLTTANGTYKKDGFYYEIPNYNNGYNGCVNPELYMNDTLAKDYQAAPVPFGPGTTSHQVKVLQSILQDTGFFPAKTKVTEFWGPITTQSYDKFKAATGFELIPISTSTGGEEVLPLSGMFTLKLGDIARALAVALLTGAWLSIAGLFVQGFDVFSADWLAIGKTAVNGGFFALVGYISKNLLTADNGRLFGVL